MNDRELLEMAARAAGYSGRWIKWPGARHPLDVELGFFHGSDGSVWNPLSSDGDALRLAVKLNMLIDCCGMCARPLDDSFEWMDATGPDEFANMRRAITLCAAEIGRRMG